MLGLSNIEINDILNKYYSGHKVTDIELSYNLKAGSISYIRKKLKKPAYKKFSDELLSKIVQEHINGKLMKDIEKEYNISNHTIYRHMKKNNIIFKNNHGRKHKFNEDYFEIINSEHKAYWLGFIYADGNISNTGSGNTRPNRLTINISNKDIEILENFCNDINADINIIKTYRPKETYSNNLMSKIYLNSQKLCSDLTKWGVFPNKTGKLTSFPQISKKYIPHFIRGFFDGDGWVSKSRNNLTVGFIGDEYFLTNISNEFLHIGASRRILHKELRKLFPIYYLRYSSKKDLSLIFNYLYKNATIYLKRKYNAFLNDVD